MICSRRPPGISTPWKMSTTPGTSKLNLRYFSLTFLRFYSFFFIQDCSIQVQQSGAAFILNEGFDVIFSLITEYHKAATIDMKQHGFSVMMKSMEKLVQNLASVLNAGSGPGLLVGNWILSKVGSDAFCSGD